jgi:nitrilase
MNSGADLAGNLVRAGFMIASAAEDGAELVVLPENFAFMGASQRDRLTVAEQDGAGPVQDFLAREAARHHIWIVGGTVPLKDENELLPAAACLVFDGDGRRVGRYDKIHLFDVAVPASTESYRESVATRPGRKPLLVDTPCGRLGISVCYDLRFPELYRAMADRGVEVIALPAAFTAITGRAHWETLIRARAIENLSYFIAAGQGGFHVASRETYGHSMIVDPWGTKLAERERGNGCVVAEIDPEFQHTTRRNFPCLDHRRLHCH